MEFFRSHRSAEVPIGRFLLILGGDRRPKMAYSWQNASEWLTNTAPQPSVAACTATGTTGIGKKPPTSHDKKEISAL
jgi:hypothetical protein